MQTLDVASRSDQPLLLPNGIPRTRPPVPATLRCFRCGKERYCENGELLGYELEITVLSGTAAWCEVREKLVWDSKKQRVWFHILCAHEHVLEEIIDLD